MIDLDQVRAEALNSIAAAAGLEALEGLRVSLLGKKGSISLLMKSLGEMSPEERKTAGQQLNAVKDAAAAALEERKVVLEASALDERLSRERIDVTLPIGLGYNFLGLSEVLPDMNRGTGDVDIGVTATVDRSWTGTLSLTRYFGRSKIPYLGDDTRGPPLADWNFIALTLQRTF